MTEYDYSPDAIERYQATMRRISRWVDDAEAHACEFKSPFVPRSDVGDDDVPAQPVLSRGMSKRVPPPLYAPVPGPMPPHSHGPAPPPPRPPQVPLHGPAPPPSHSRHSPTRHSSSRRSSSHPSHSKHRSGSTYYVSPTPTPPLPYYPAYNNPYYQARPSPYAPPPPPPQYYRSGNVVYAPPQGGYIVMPQKGRSSKVVVMRTGCSFTISGIVNNIITHVPTSGGVTSFQILHCQYLDLGASHAVQMLKCPHSSDSPLACK
ncbi:hypothetical protein IW261DRAFT_1598745 [Armillaria novae-zelandiae]|uniref:Uncharacterized protein n=1 Tax=Armillaria novae-zelandiae TaxID=153914 RepID=A0AA39NEI5_9AGAR|nr:hypothetical protein IW261DRAFT_1598745 [Armillaria novae-zelandiae]